MKKIITTVAMLFALIGELSNTYAQTAYITNSGDSTVSVIDVTTNTVTTTIAVGHGPWGVSVSTDGSKVYVTNVNDNKISVINTTTNTVTATITVGSAPIETAVSPDGSKAYVANYNAYPAGTVSVINTATNTISATIKVGLNPEGIAVSPDGSKIYVASNEYDSVSVINSATNTVSKSIKVGINPISFGNFISIYPNINDTICSAHYTIVPSSTPHLYYVTDSVTGVPPFKYLWEWGDGTHDTIAYPSHTYSVAGSYTICFTITDSTGCTSTYCNSSYLSKTLSSMIYVDVVPVVPTGINEKGLTNQIKVFPNPVTEEIQVISNQCSVNSVEIYNILGEKIYSLPITDNRSPASQAKRGEPITINCSSFAKGVYFIILTAEEGKAVKKFVKE